MFFIYSYVGTGEGVQETRHEVRRRGLKRREIDCQNFLRPVQYAHHDGPAGPCSAKGKKDLRQFEGCQSFTEDMALGTNQMAEAPLKCPPVIRHGSHGRILQ